MSKNILYYGFNPLDKYTGSQLDPVIGTETATVGDLCQPGDIVKLSAGTNAWNQDPQTITNFLNSEVTISSMEKSDWTEEQKDEWFEGYLKYVGLESLVDSLYYQELFDYAEVINIFEELSGASIAYVDQSTSGEVTICCTVYENDFILQYALSLPNSDDLRTIILSEHIVKPPYISNVFKTSYNGFEHVTWCFDGIIYTEYNLSNLSIEPSLTNGGGNIFGEVKLAGDGIRAHYLVKKNVDPKDPTIGLCSGEPGPFCMGDEIILIDTSVYTKDNGTNGWSWIGDFTQLDGLNTWHIADVTDPCTDYANVPIFDQLFPLRVIAFCRYQNFG